MPLSSNGEVVAPTDLSGRLLEYCGALAELAPLAVRQTKRLVARALFVDDPEARVRHEAQLAGRGLNTEDGKEAVAAIMEKRAPNFVGR